MPRRKIVFFDPKFNEWLYDILVNLTINQKSQLNRYELNIIRNATALKRFVANENLERKLTLLSKLGIEWSIGFFQTENYFGKAVNQVYRQYSIKNQTVENISEMIKSKMFVIGSKEVALALALMSNNCHSEVYSLNPGFLAFKQTLKANKKSANISVGQLMAKTNANIIHNDVTRETRNLTKLLLENLLFEPYITGVENLQMLDVAILWLLYISPRNYVKVDTIKDQLKIKYKPASIGLRCSYLFRERRLIDKRPSQENVNSYIIMQEGISVVGRINNYLVNKIFEE